MIASATLALDVSASTGKARVSYLRRHLCGAHAILKPALRELSLALVNDAEMSELHRHFLGIAGPTDVLSFPLETDSRRRVTSGEIVVCVPEAARQARLRGVPLERELLLYSLHGMLHLCGYNDKTPREFRRMHRAEDMILTKLGVGPVFKHSRAKPGKGARR
jgi:probable rRNA maturation factor